MRAFMSIPHAFHFIDLQGPRSSENGCIKRQSTRPRTSFGKIKQQQKNELYLLCANRLSSCLSVIKSSNLSTQIPTRAAAAVESLLASSELLWNREAETKEREFIHKLLERYFTICVVISWSLGSCEPLLQQFKTLHAWRLNLDFGPQLMRKERHLVRSNNCARLIPFVSVNWVWRSPVPA